MIPEPTLPLFSTPWSRPLHPSSLLPLPSESATTWTWGPQSLWAAAATSSSTDRMQPGSAKATWTVRTPTPAYLHLRPEYPQCSAPWKSCFRADRSPSCRQLQGLNSAQTRSKEALNRSSDVGWAEGTVGSLTQP